MTLPDYRRLPDPAFWRGKSVLVTGHTGFKGGWLSLALCRLGAKVRGVSLDPDPGPTFFEALGLRELFEDDLRIDIRDRDALIEAMKRLSPELVFHLAAQPIVRQSYRDPLESFQTNIMGTANLLDVYRGKAAAPRAFITVTSDKCYENNGEGRAFTETDRLGGHDPYSASKAGAEIIAASMRASFFCERDDMKVATARAGNVVGGGDFADDRLIPDFVRARIAGEPLIIRNPEFTRPWQHVLEPVLGYLLLAEDLCGPEASEYAQGWNFGPDSEANQTVRRVIEICADNWPGPDPNLANASGPHEATLLSLNSEKAKTKLNWQPLWALDETLAHTIDWYRSWAEKQDMMHITVKQLEAYLGE